MILSGNSKGYTKLVVLLTSLFLSHADVNNRLPHKMSKTPQKEGEKELS